MAKLTTVLKESAIGLGEHYTLQRVSGASLTKFLMSPARSKGRGRLSSSGPATVLEAIMEAGGFTPEAELKRVSVIRIVKGEHYTQLYDFRPVLPGNPTNAVYVNGGRRDLRPRKTLEFLMDAKPASACM